jgi:predicted RNA-binding protein YlxR (DUF448 family)
MCINCRDKIPQKSLIRLQCIEGRVISFRGIGRSFYLCKNCIDKRDEKKIKKILSNRCKRDVDISELESILDG